MSRTIASTTTRARRGATFARLALVPLLACGLALGGCGTQSSDEGSPGVEAVGSQAMLDMERAEEASAAPEKNAASPQAASPRTERPQSQVIVTGSLSLTVDEPAKTLEEVRALVAKAEGRVESSTLEGSGSRGARATLRIPAKDYDAAVEEIAALGTVNSRTTNTEEVGAVVADLDARATALEASIQRLTDLMKDAQSTYDLIEAERELTNRQADLDALKAQRTWYSDQIGYSTLEVTIRSAAVAPEPSGSAWQTSWELFVGALSSIAYALIIAAPWLLVLVPLGAALHLLRRGAKKRRAKRAEGASSAASPVLPASAIDEDGDGAPDGGEPAVLAPSEPESEKNEAASSMGNIVEAPGTTNPEEEQS